MRSNKAYAKAIRVCPSSISIALPQRKEGDPWIPSRSQANSTTVPKGKEGARPIVQSPNLEQTAAAVVYFHLKYVQGAIAVAVPQWKGGAPPIPVNPQRIPISPDDNLANMLDSRSAFFRLAIGQAEKQSRLSLRFKQYYFENRKFLLIPDFQVENRELRLFFGALAEFFFVLLPVQPIVAVVISTLIAVSYRFGTMLLMFLFTSSKLTRFGEDKKRKLDAEFKEGGQRNWIQVLFNSGIATVFVLISWKLIGSQDKCLDSNDSYLVTSLIGAAGLELISAGKQLHCFAAKLGLADDIFISCSLINMYSKCGSIEDAQFVFDEMPEKTSVGWGGWFSGQIMKAYLDIGWGGWFLVWSQP